MATGLLVIVRHQVEMAAHIQTFNLDVRRPIREIRLALDDIGRHPFLKSLRSGFVASAGRKIRLILQCHCGVLDEYRSRSFSQVARKRRVRVR